MAPEPMVARISQSLAAMPTLMSSALKSHRVNLDINESNGMSFLPSLPPRGAYVSLPLPFSLLPPPPPFWFARLFPNRPLSFPPPHAQLPQAMQLTAPPRCPSPPPHPPLQHPTLHPVIPASATSLSVPPSPRRHIHRSRSPLCTRHFPDLLATIFPPCSHLLQVSSPPPKTLLQTCPLVMQATSRGCTCYCLLLAKISYISARSELMHRTNGS